MVHVNMSKEPESRVVTGINLWEVRDAKLERAASGARGWMLSYTLKFRDAELKDRAQLEGNGWYFGRPKLLAMGLPLAFDGDIDPLDFIGKKVWLATIGKKDISTKTGKPTEYTIVDETQLDRGYQHADRVPDGATVAAAGLGPDEPEPF
jgi:hypothetical protein